jgi:hypothetical protein
LVDTLSCCGHDKRTPSGYTAGMSKLLRSFLVTSVLVACSPSVTPPSESAQRPQSAPDATVAPDSQQTSPAEPSSGGLAADSTAQTCCDQCSSAAGRDPAGMDISVKSCLSYEGEFNGRPGVSKECAAYFRASPATLGDCRQRKQ